MSTAVNTIRVLHLRSSPFLGSPERLILGRLKCMNRSFSQYIVGIFDEQHKEDNSFMAEAEKLGCLVILLYDSILFFPFNIIRLYKALRASHVQIICAHDYKANMYGWILGTFLKIPLMSVLHGKTWSDFKVRLYGKLDDLVLLSYDALICVSRKDLDERKKLKKINNCHLFYIPNAVDANEIEKLSLIPDNQCESLKKNNAHLVLYAGRLSKEKGLYHLIEAAKKILARRNDVLFLILGDGPERLALERMISDYRLNQFIQLWGFKKNIYPFYRAMDFLVLPSFTEGMPVVILEAFSLGKPVIATMVGGIPDIVEHNVNGMLVSPKSTPELITAIEYFLDHPGQARKMGEKGRMLIKEHYTFATQTDRYLNAYRKVIADNSRQ